MKTKTPQPKNGSRSTTRADGLVVVAKANPSRSNKFQIAHFRRSYRSLDTLRQFDKFKPTFSGAVEWVKHHYPSAHIRKIGKRPDGVVAAVTFYCQVSDFCACNHGTGQS